MIEKKEISKKCHLCSNTIRGVPFTLKEMMEIFAALDSKKKNKQVAIQCPACKAVYCSTTHKKELGFSFFGGYNKKTCKACGAEFGDHYYILASPVILPTDMQKTIKIIPFESAVPNTASHSLHDLHEDVTLGTENITVRLFQSIAKKDAKKVLEALRNGADANACDGRGTSALKYAMPFGDVETAKVLIEHGAKVKGQDILPELAAYGSGGVAMAKLLLEAGADVDERTPGGYTPLIIAAGRGYTDIVKVLLEAGADVRAVGASNRTAKSLSYERGYLETAHLIEKWEKTG